MHYSASQHGHYTEFQFYLAVGTHDGIISPSRPRATYPRSSQIALADAQKSLSTRRRFRTALGPTRIRRGQYLYPSPQSNRHRAQHFTRRVIQLGIAAFTLRQITAPKTNRPDRSPRRRQIDSRPKARRDPQRPLHRTRSRNRKRNGHAP